MPPPAAEPQSAVPLCVDLDGTLIRTDLLWESLVRLLRRNPFMIFAAMAWWLRGRANLKAQVASRVSLDAAALPYNEALLDYLRAEKIAGRTILLVTASDARLARVVAAHVGLFNDVLASDGQVNLRGKNKVGELERRFGKGGFDYAGNSTVDLPVWQKSRHALVVSGDAGLAARAGALTDVSRVFDAGSSSLRACFRALRPHQWVKNLIVFVPLLTSHNLTKPAMATNACLAFITFCLCASAAYLLNDLLDLDNDRRHPTKRLRPFASGELQIQVGLAGFPLLLAAGAILAFTLPWRFAAVAGVYLVLTTSYSAQLKKIPLIDVFCLTGLYSIRLIAGHEATGVPYSLWLLLFSMFIFLSLALVKRFTELDMARQQNRSEVSGRGYAAADQEFVAMLGASTGCLAVLVLALYVNSQEVRILYQHPMRLLAACPLLLYWISRVWMLAHRGAMHEDPIVFALKDPVSYLIGALTLAILWIAAGP